MNRYQALAAAEATVKDREEHYGNPQQNFERIAALWNVILAGKLYKDTHSQLLNFSCQISAADVAMMMIGIKLARLIETPDHQDSAVDLAGYAALLQEIA